MAESGSADLLEMATKLTLSETSQNTQVAKDHAPSNSETLQNPQVPKDHVPSNGEILQKTQPHEDHAPSHTHQDSETDEDLLGKSLEDEVGTLLRATVEELETALQESRKLLAERDEELVKVRSELERYKQQTAREIANKTKLAQVLDESHKHARELEELLQQWQMEVRETKLHGERLTASYQRELSRGAQLERTLQETQEQKDKEMEQLKTQLIGARQNLSRSSSSGGGTADSNPVDEMQLHFLKQAVYHLLTDFHAEDQLRAIVSILDFTPQERKAVYAKLQEKGKFRGAIRTT